MRRLLTGGVKKLIIAIVILVAISSVFYGKVEGWNPVDSFYFTIMTITTVGHADLVPTTAVSKIFTSIVAFVGIAMMLTLFGIISSHYVKLFNEK